jgi:hypothetical protein
MRAGTAAAAPRGRRRPCPKSRATFAGAFAFARIDHEEDEHEPRGEVCLA